MVVKKRKISKPSLYSISKMRITPAQKVKFHRREAVASLKKGNFAGYRYHSMKVAGINSNLIIARMKAKKGI